MLNINTDTLRGIFNEIERRLNSSSILDHPSYGEVLDEIQTVNEGLYNQLNADINCRFRVDGERPLNTLLHFVAKENYPQIVKLLLDNDANVNANNSPSRYTPLHYAAQEGHLKVVQELLHYRANVDAMATLSNITPLYRAVQNGHSEVVQELLDHGASVDVVAILDQKTPLHLAAARGDSEIVQKLLDKNANFEAVNRDGDTPLHIAAFRGHSRVVQKLLDKNADINQRNNNGQTPLDCAVNGHHEDASKILIEYTLAQDINAQKPNFAILLPANPLHETLSKCWDLQLMKPINIGSMELRDSNNRPYSENVSLYDFFTADDTKLGLYVKKLGGLLNPEQLLENSPEFTEVFLYKLKKGFVYNIIRDKVSFGTKGELKELTLPPELTEEINKYLDDESRDFLLRASISKELVESVNRFLDYGNREALLGELARLQRNNQEQGSQSTHPLDADVSALNRNEVSTWKKPEIINTIEHDTPTRFDGQIILQLENDPVVMEAAARLAAKHPESSVVVQLDTQGNYQAVYGNLDILKGKENLRWQVVGHGRTDKTIGGYSATALADQIADFTIELDTEYNISSSPKYISLVGCSLIDNVEMNYARELALSLDEQGISADIAARSARVAVTDAGKKLTQDSAGNWNYKISEDKVIYVWNEDGELVPQIGQRAVQLLKSMDLAENFHQAMSELYKSNQLPKGKWLPILRNATEDTKDGYPVQFINAEQQLQTLTIGDQRIIDFIEDYNKKLVAINKTHDTLIESVDRQSNPVFDVESVDGLNSAFIVKTLIPWFANKSRMAATGDDTPEILKTALQVHTWVNLAQMGQGTVEDIAKITKLYQVAIAVSEGKEVASEMLSPVKSASTGIGVFLNIGSIVLDSIELANAQNEAQKAIYGTQLAFDTAGLVTSVVGIGASIAGATTIAALAGAGGVILGGLGVGVTALAEAFSEVATRAQMVGKYFADLDAAYSQGGYRHSTKTMKDGTTYDVMEPIPGAVITTLDLPNKQLTFDSQYIYRTHHNSTGSGKINYFFWGMPEMVLDKTQAINIREGIGYPATEISFDYNNTTLILPTTLKTYLMYEYIALPFVTGRHDRGFNVLRRLEEDGRFDFDFYTFPSEQVVCKLRPEYMETSIKVILDEQNRDILIPQLPQHIKGKLSYQLCGNGGEYRISLQDGVSLFLQSGNSNTNWILDAWQLDSIETSIDKNLLKVGNVEITLPDESCGNISIIDSNNDIFVVDRESKEVVLLEVNGKQFTDWQALHEHLNLLTNHLHPDNHNSFVTVDNYQPAGGGNVGRAFYEVSADRFIYTNKPEWSEFLSSAELAKVEGNKAWFYRNTEIWQVEIATGKVLRQYLPFNTVDMEFISSSVLQHDNQLYVVIKQKLDDNNFTYTYHIEDEALKLVAIDGDTALVAKLENSNEEELSSILIMPTIDYDQWLTEKNLTFSDHQVKATPANVVKISDNKWLCFDEHGIKDFVKVNAEPEDLVLAFVSEHAGYFFYSNKERSIYFQKDNGLSGTQATKVDVNSVKSIFSHNQKHFVLTYEGTLWSLDDQGTATLAGITADWLGHHRKNLIKDLGQLADDTVNKFNNLLLLGMQDSNGNSVNAWYDNIDDLVIQGGPNLNAEHNLTYLGLANDNKQAWIFDADDQKIYRQPLKDLVLDEKLMLTVLGDSAELFHPDQKYVNVVRDGTNLRMETSDGAILLLPMNSDLTDKPTLIAFHVKEHEPEEILSALQALIDDYKLPSAIRLLVESDQEPAWYLTEEKKIIHGNGLEDGHFLHYLGKAAGLENWYIHDQNTGQLWSVSSDQSVVVGNYSFVHLEQGHLILQVSEITPSGLPQLQEVSNLIISSKLPGQHNYLLDSSLLTHYQQIVIDDQGTNAIIQLDLENNSTFSLQCSDKDIILHYDSLNTDILISNIEQAVQQGMVLNIMHPIN